MERESVFLMNHNCEKFTVGIEEEYMVCDPKTGSLVNKASLIMDHFKNSIPDRYSFELIESEIEANTSVHYEMRDAIFELSQLRSKLKELGTKNNFMIGISGTHPTASPSDQTFINNESYSWVQDQLQYYAKRNMTFSTHVHISLPDFDCVTHVMNGVRRWLAPLLALSANSPFFEGEITGMRSSRTMQFGAFPRTNIPEEFDSLSKYVSYAQKLTKANSISKSRHIWWKIRPHLDYKTLEFRVCDAQRSLENVRVLSSLCRALVHAAYVEYMDNKLFEKLSIEFLNDSLWKASRFDFNSLIYDEVSDDIMSMKNFIQKMYDYCYESLKLFGDQDIINRIESLLENGTEGDEQIDVYKRQNFDGLKLFLINNVDYLVKE